MIARHENRGVVVEPHVLQLADVLGKHLQAAADLTDRIGVVRADVVAVLVKVERIVPAEQMDEAESTRLAVVGRGKPRRLELIVIGPVVHRVERALLHLPVVAFHLQRHAVVDLVGVEPEIRLERPGQVTVHRALPQREEGALLIEQRGGILLIHGVVIHSEARHMALHVLARIFGSERIGVDAHAVAGVVDVVQVRAALIARSEVLREELALLRKLAGQEERHAVARGNHGARNIVIPGETRPVVEFLRMLLHNLGHLLRVGEVEDEDDDVAFLGNGEQAVLSHAQVGDVYLTRLFRSRLECARREEAAHADTLHDDERKGKRNRAAAREVRLQMPHNKGNRHDDDPHHGAHQHD